MTACLPQPPIGPTESLCRHGDPDGGSGPDTDQPTQVHPAATAPDAAAGMLPPCVSMEAPLDAPPADARKTPAAPPVVQDLGTWPRSCRGGGRASLQHSRSQAPANCNRRGRRDPTWPSQTPGEEPTGGHDGDLPFVGIRRWQRIQSPSSNGYSRWCQATDTVAGPEGVQKPLHFP